MYRLCQDFKVENYGFLQNPANLKNIAIVGKNARSIPDEAIELCLKKNKEFECYSVFASTHDGQIHTKLCGWTNSLKVEKFNLQSRATCELIVKVTTTDNNVRVLYITVYFAKPIFKLLLCLIQSAHLYGGGFLPLE